MENFMRITTTQIGQVSLYADKAFSQWTLSQTQTAELIEALQAALDDVEKKAFVRRIPIERWMAPNTN